jgi:hypothetical protein
VPSQPGAGNRNNRIVEESDAGKMRVESGRKRNRIIAAGPGFSPTLRSTTMCLIIAADLQSQRAITFIGIDLTIFAYGTRGVASFEPDQGCRNALFLDVALGIELLEVGSQVLDFLFVLDTGKDHLGAGNLGRGVLDVFGEGLFVPDDAGILVGVRIAGASHAARVAAVEAVKLGPD